MEREDTQATSDVPETLEGMRDYLRNFRADYDSHNHDGANSRRFQTLVAETLAARTFSIRKTSYTDNTPGFWVGLVGSLVKFFLGSATSYLKWDGTMMTYTGASRLTAKFTTIFEDTARFGLTGTGTGQITSGGLQMFPTSTANRFKSTVASVGSVLLEPFLNSWFTTIFGFDSFDTVGAGNNGSFYIGTSMALASGDGTSFACTNKQYGFKALKVDGVVTLYATNADGVTETATSLGVIAENDNFILSAVYLDGAIKFYNNGVLVATHTTNLPATSTQTSAVFRAFINNSNTAFNFAATISSFTYEKLVGIA
jgi:hypothetical protein